MNRDGKPQLRLPVNFFGDVMITHIFFDLGSTLYDESACVAKRIEGVLSQAGAPPREVFIQKVNELAMTSWQFTKAAADFYGLSVPHWDSSLERVYPDAAEVLEALSKKYSLGVIANQSAGAEARMEEHGIRKFFDTVVLSAEAGLAKPDPEIFRLALKLSGCKAENAAMIGDRADNDIAPATRLGMKTVWVRQGIFAEARFSRLDEGADYIVYSLRELLGIF